jgi:hypothetical protein
MRLIFTGAGRGEMAVVSSLAVVSGLVVMGTPLAVISIRAAPFPNLAALPGVECRVAAAFAIR